ncbi:MAG: hypothetical protein M5R36_28845 [Deltaproteobacteria bacterium]|nr:hypothetical protein [Deltaproteobacteria bacterium]
MAYGYFRGRSDGDDLIVEHDGGEKRFHFPRRREEPTIAVPDFFRADDDLIAFLVVTLGDGAAARGQELLGKEGYQDYFLLHGLATEVTDALAEYGHALMRHELGIGEKEKLDWQALVTQKYRGSRYAFGYPACPDLAQNAPVMELVGAERIGVTLTEEHQMVPEFSTSAIVAHHPKAKYFAV